MRKLCSCVAASIVSLVLGSQVAVATEPTESAGAVITVTPRLWYIWAGAKVFVGDSPDPTFQFSDQMVEIPLYGASVTLAPRSFGGSALSFTIFHGDGDGDYAEINTVSIAPFAGLFLNWKGKEELERLDAEVVWQTPVGSGAYYAFGARYINVKGDVDASLARSNSILATGGTLTYRANADIYLGSLAFGTSNAVSKNGKFKLFGNASLLVGHLNVENRRTMVITTPAPGPAVVTTTIRSGGVVGIDANAGLVYRFGDSGTISGRYRLFTLSGADFELNDETAFVHGPELNLTFQLN